MQHNITDTDDQFIDKQLILFKEALCRNTGLSLLVDYHFYKLICSLMISNPNKFDDATKTSYYLKGLSVKEAKEKGYFEKNGMLKATILKQDLVDQRLKNDFEDSPELTDEQRIVLATFIWHPFLSITPTIEHEIPRLKEHSNASSNEQSLYSYAITTFQNRFNTAICDLSKQNKSIFNGDTSTFTDNFLFFLSCKVEETQSLLRTKNILDASNSVIDTADQAFVLASNVFSLCVDLTAYRNMGPYTALYQDILNGIAFCRHLTLEKLQDFYRALTNLETLLKLKSEQIQSYVLNIHEIENQELRHRVLMAAYNGYNTDLYQAFQNLERVITMGPPTLVEALATLTKEPSAIESRLQACGRQIAHQVHKLASDPKFTRTDLLVNALQVTEANISSPSFDNYNKLIKVSQDLGQYQKGKILSRSLIVLGGIALISLGIAMAVGCPPLGLITTVLGGSLIAGVAFGGVGVVTSGLGFYAVKKAAIKESQVVQNMIHELPKSVKKQLRSDG